MTDTGHTTPVVQISEIGPDLAEVVTGLIHLGFDNRPTLDPPAPALDESIETVGRALETYGGLLASMNGEPVGALLLHEEDAWFGLRRVTVAPAGRRLGVAKAMEAAAEEVARRRGYDRIRLTAREELPATIGLWTSLGYREISRSGPLLMLAKELSVRCLADDAEATHELGRRIATQLRPGDVVILSGDLGAGKTTLTQGIGAGLGIRGPVTSPTFVISRIHPSLDSGPSLVHVDAYRLAGLTELDDLDLDVSVEESVTVVEWGEGVAERLAADRLEVTLLRRHGAGEQSAGQPAEPLGEQRTITLNGIGARWVGSDLRATVA